MAEFYEPLVVLTRAGRFARLKEKKVNEERRIVKIMIDQAEKGSNVAYIFIDPDAMFSFEEIKMRFGDRYHIVVLEGTPELVTKIKISWQV